MPVKVRALFGFCAFVLFAAIGSFVEAEVWTQWWFYVGLATLLAAVFVEPFFTKPQDTIINCAAGVAAYFSADRDALPSLWNLYLTVVLTIMLIGLCATLIQRDSIGKLFLYQVSARCGTAVFLGSIALFLEVTSRIVRGDRDAIYLGAATAVLAATLSIDWTSLWLRTRRRRSSDYISVVDAQSPSLVLVEGISVKVRPGATVALIDGNIEVAGVVVTVLPGKTARGVIALDGEWRSIAPRLPIRADLMLRGELSTLYGLASAGSTPTSVVFDAIRPVDVGDIVVLNNNAGSQDPRLYQVFSTRLTDENWGGSRGLLAQVTALQLGTNDSGYLRVSPRLPLPHARVESPAEQPFQRVPHGYCKVGAIKGTNYEIGVARDATLSGHIAVLGMSGMGKTHLVSMMCRSLGSEKFVLAVDTTGEYAQRLSFPSWNGEHVGVAGHYVHEPQGDPPARVRKLVENMMGKAYEEYTLGEHIPRLLCLEEAHSFVPEWNFCTRNQQDEVTHTTRMIMQARKYGISFMIVSQRTAVVSKSALSQCESYAVFRTLDDTSLSYLETLAGPVVRDVAPALGRYEMLCIGPAFNADSPVVVSVSAADDSQVDKLVDLDVVKEEQLQR